MRCMLRQGRASEPGDRVRKCAQPTETVTHPAEYELRDCKSLLRESGVEGLMGELAVWTQQITEESMGVLGEWGYHGAV